MASRAETEARQEADRQALVGQLNAGADAIYHGNVIYSSDGQVAGYSDYARRQSMIYAGGDTDGL